MNFDLSIFAAGGLADHLCRRILRRKGMDERSIKALERKVNLVMICLFGVVLIALTAIMN